MIKSLRKRHFEIWSALMVLLPVGIIFSWLVIPNSSPVKLLQSRTADLLPVIKNTCDKKDYTIHLRSNRENTQWQLEWKSKRVLAVPSAIIYQTSAPSSDSTNKGVLTLFKPQDAVLIGRIEARGDYVFPLHTDLSNHKELKFILYDFIHQQRIDSIKFLQ